MACFCFSHCESHFAPHATLRPQPTVRPACCLPPALMGRRSKGDERGHEDGREVARNIWVLSWRDRRRSVGGLNSKVLSITANVTQSRERYGLPRLPGTVASVYSIHKEKICCICCSLYKLALKGQVQAYGGSGSTYVFTAATYRTSAGV